MTDPRPKLALARRMTAGDLTGTVQSDAGGEIGRLMQSLQIDPEKALLRLPLQMRYPADSGGMDFIAPRLPAPLLPPLCPASS